MSAYDRWLESPAQDQYAQQEAAQRYMESKERSLAADDDVLLEALADALCDKRTRAEVVRLYREGDLLAMATLMHMHVPTYITEAAEVAYLAAKEDRQ